jgi:acyl-CoA oxidase
MADFKTSAKTFTSNHQTNNRFEIEKLTQILEGEQATIIKKVKSVISRPDLYETSTDIAVYREKSMSGVKYLQKKT